MSTSTRRWSPWTEPVPKRDETPLVTAGDIAHTAGIETVQLGVWTHSFHMQAGEPCQCVENAREGLLGAGVVILRGGRALYVSPF